jgi:hypothetical protein
MATAVAFKNTITASKWTTIVSQLRDIAEKAHGSQQTEHGVWAPPMTNAELQTLVRAWKGIAGVDAFPLWSQFAAVGYGWDPEEPAVLDSSARQRDRLVEPDLALSLWLSMSSMAYALDDARRDPVRMQFDTGAFSDPVWKAQVLADMRADGATLAWKVPTPVCEDMKTGEKHFPHMTCKKGWRLVEVKRGVFMCRAPAGSSAPDEFPTWRCDAPVMVDDPITVVKNDFGRLLLMLGGAYLVWQHVTRPSRRKER